MLSASLTCIHNFLMRLAILCVSIYAYGVNPQRVMYPQFRGSFLVPFSIVWGSHRVASIEFRNAFIGMKQQYTLSPK